MSEQATYHENIDCCYNCLSANWACEGEIQCFHDPAPKGLGPYCYGMGWGWCEYFKREEEEEPQ